MNELVESPTDADLEAIESHRSWIQEHFPPELGRDPSEFDRKLDLLDALIKGGWIDPAQTTQLHCLGVILGDAFVEEKGFEWVMVKSGYSREPAIRFPETSIVLYPLEMISRKIENGEKVDVPALFEGICASVDSKLKQGA